MKELPIRLVIDTNALFMSLHNPFGKAAKIISLANQEKIILFSPESVKAELFNVMKREFKITEEEIIFVIESLPVKWVEESIYMELLDKTEVKHKPDKPVEAVALLLNCEILTANYHFKKRADIDEIIKRTGD